MSEETVRDGMVVAITYAIIDSEGRVLEQSDIPIEYVHGRDQRLFPKIMTNLAGKTVGESVDVFFSAEEKAFGEPDPGLTFSDDIDNVPPEFRRIGAEAVFENEAGETVTMRVVRIADGKVHLDGNHPLIGKDLTFRVTVQGIRPATEAELAAGEPGGVPRVH